MKKKTGLLLLLGMICLAGIGVCGWNLYRELMPRIQANHSYDKIRLMAFPGSDDAVSPPVPDFAALTAWNPDVRAWIWSPGTDIDYPVMQAGDNEYYLNHTADREKSVIGAIFMESANRGDFRDDLTVLYGHHIQGGRMFSSLSGYKEQKYYEEHPVMHLYTPQENYRVELFAGNIINGSESGFPLSFSDEAGRLEWVLRLLAESTFRSGVMPEEGERIIALCTCTYEYQNARYVVYGVLRELEE